MSVTIIPIPNERPALSRPHINTNFEELAAAIEVLQLRLLTAVVAYAATIATDASTAGIFEIEALTGPLTLSNPTNGVDGQTITWLIEQDATGGRVVTLGNKFIAPSSSSITSPLPWSTAANEVDLLTAQYRASIDKWMITEFRFGYANT